MIPHNTEVYPIIINSKVRNEKLIMTGNYRFKIALTGQSGPPIKIATFGTLSPLFPITSLIDLINCELIPTN